MDWSMSNATCARLSFSGMAVVQSDPDQSVRSDLPGGVAGEDSRSLMAGSNLRWQQRMVPAMVGMLVVSAIFFAAVALARFASIESAVTAAPPAPPPIEWSRPDAAPTSWRDQAELASQEASYALERDLIARRYTQATYQFVSRLWTRFMGFLTGMILALVGAAFVLGKIDAPATDLSASGSGAGLALKTASPGLVLAVLGTVLMGMSIVVTGAIAVQDGAVYVARGAGAVGADLPPEPPRAERDLPPSAQPQLKPSRLKKDPAP